MVRAMFLGLCSSLVQENPSITEKGTFCLQILTAVAWGVLVTHEKSRVPDL